MADTEACTPLSSRAAIDAISRYLPREWSGLTDDQVTVERITGGLANTVNIVTRSTESIAEPKQVIVHQVGGGSWSVKRGRDEPFATRFEELLVFHESSRIGTGPKLYGASEELTVQEYVHSRTLTPEDCLNKNVLTKLAQTYAKFHTIDLPINRTKHIENRSSFKDKCKQFVESKEKLKTFAQKSFCDLNWDEVFEVDFETEFDWIVRIYERIGTRKVVNTGDQNYLNVLIANEGDRVALIDYEMTKFDSRANDLGGHLINRAFNWSDKSNKASGYDILVKDLFRHFIAEYCKESAKLVKNFDPNGLDSVDHVMQEAELGILTYALTGSAVFIFAMENLAQIENGSFCRAGHQLAKLYLKRKEELLSEHPDCK